MEYIREVKITINGKEFNDIYEEEFTLIDDAINYIETAVLWIKS